MKTYARAEGEKEFDWNKFLKKEKFTEEELDDADYKASDWVTCACGNMCSIIPREDGQPLDKRLAKLGEAFANHVSKMQENYTDPNTPVSCWTDEAEKKKELTQEKKVFEKARKNAIKTLEKIEVRSTEVIREEFMKMESTMKAVGLKLVKLKN